MQEVMRTTMAWNQQFAVAMPKKVFVGDDSPGFAIRLACKDVRLACEAAEAMGFKALVGRGAQATMERAIEMGKGDRDTAALMFIREKELGIEVRQKPIPSDHSLKQRYSPQPASVVPGCPAPARG